MQAESPSPSNDVRLDIAMFVARSFWGPICGLVAIPTFMIVDRLRLGQSVEDLAMVAGLALGWSLGEAIVRRSLLALATCAIPGVPLSLLVWCVLNDDLHSVAACVGVSVGMAVSAWIFDKSFKLGLAVFASCLLGAALLAGCLMLRQGPDARFMRNTVTLLGGLVPHVAAGTALLIGYRLQRRPPRRLWQYSLRAFMAFYLLVGTEIAIAFSFRTPFEMNASEMQRFDDLGKRAQLFLASDPEEQPLDDSVTRVAAIAAKYNLPLAKIEEYLGPGTFDPKEGEYQWVIPCSPNSTDLRPPIQRIDAVCEGEEKRVLSVVASGPDVFITDPHWREREDGMLLFFVVLCLPFNVLLIHLGGWASRKLQDRGGQ